MSTATRPKPDPRRFFHSDAQLRLNARRLEHLACLDLVRPGCTVLDAGAGLGDLSTYFINRGCATMVTEGRPELVAMIRAGQGMVEPKHGMVLNLDRPPQPPSIPLNVVMCFSVLHLLERPAEALAFLRACVSPDGIMLVETPVTPGPEDALTLGIVSRSEPDSSLTGKGGRPTRQWVWNRLREHFANVYVPRFQPDHEAFPTDWTTIRRGQPARALFVASGKELLNDGLSPVLLEQHARYT